MECVRQRLDVDATSARTSVKSMTDWRSMVRKHPLVAAGAVGVAGYLLVPQRRVQQIVDSEALKRLADEHRVVVAPSESKKDRSMLSTIVAITTAGVARAAGVYLAGKMGEFASTAGHRES